MIDDCRFLEFNGTIFSLEHIKYVWYGYQDGDVLYNKLMTITYWDGDSIDLIGVIGYNKDELDNIYEKIREILLNNYECYEE